MDIGDPIVAVATATGFGGIGIVRISGRDLSSIMPGVLGVVPRARMATLRTFLDAGGEPIDQGIALYFPAPHSYTGEEVLELHGHGGRAVLGRLLRRCTVLGCRLAEPGEFTRRAFLNGRLDLAQAEAVSDLVEATTEEAARSALRSLQGEFSQRIRDLVGRVTDLRASVEAAIDFSDEEITPMAEDYYGATLGEIQVAATALLGVAKQGRLQRDGVQVAIVGRPNVGKSSLLNRLSGEDAAIVTSVPGTTRDPIRRAVDIEGVVFHFIDTAGLRATEDPVERMGIERTRHTLNAADLVLVLSDVESGWTAEDENIATQIPDGAAVVRVLSKGDLMDDRPSEEPNCIVLSSLTGKGIDALKGRMLLDVGFQPGIEGVFLARERHTNAIVAAQRHLMTAADPTLTLELRAEELRLAHQELATITGEFSADDLLGEIFSRFCIGK